MAAVLVLGVLCIAIAPPDFAVERDGPSDNKEKREAERTRVEQAVQAYQEGLKIAVLTGDLAEQERLSSSLKTARARLGQVPHFFVSRRCPP